MRDGDQLISHVLSELRQITEVRIEMAEWRGWRQNTDRRVESLEAKSSDLQKQLGKVEKSSGFANYMRDHAIAFLKWVSAVILLGLAASKMLPPWVEPLVSALARVK